MSKREAFFECTFVSGRSEYQVALRAWTPGEAVAQFREALRAHGVTSSGSLLIRDLKGQLLQRATYAATAAAEAASP